MASAMRRMGGRCVKGVHPLAAAWGRECVTDLLRGEIQGHAFQADKIRVGGPSPAQPSVLLCAESYRAEGVIGAVHGPAWAGSSKRYGAEGAARWVPA